MTISKYPWLVVVLGATCLLFEPQLCPAVNRAPRGAGQICHRTQRTLRANTPEGTTEADLLIVLASKVNPGPWTRRFPQGSRLAKLSPSGKTPHDMTPDFFAAADPQTSFDGGHVLFSGKKTGDSPWQVWEMSQDGSGARPVTHCPGDCMKPAYLPRGEIVFTEFSRGSAGQVTSQLWVCKLDGSDAHPITFGPGDFEVETVLRNGAILATARSPLLPTSGLPADREFYTLRPDGTGLATLRCDHQHPALRGQAQELDDGAVVFVKSPLATAAVGGELAWIPRGALHNSPLAAPSVLASSPQPVSPGELLVAREPSGGGAALALYSFNTASGKFGAPIYEDPKLSAVDAVPVAAHEPPRWYWTTLNPELHRGYFVCLDTYQAEGLPQGRIAQKLSQVRVLTLDAATRKEVLLGTAPVQEDGSFYIAVPPDQPVRFEVLDATGQVARAQRSWIWSRSGEERGCVGCHEDRALAPENRWPMALRRFDTPTRLDLGNHPVSDH